jgi:hypothetical protein
MALPSSLTDPHQVLGILGALSAVGMLLSGVAKLLSNVEKLLRDVARLWKSYLRVRAEMRKDWDDYRLKQRASKARLQIGQPSRDITMSRGRGLL